MNEKPVVHPADRIGAVVGVIVALVGLYFMPGVSIAAGLVLPMGGAILGVAAARVIVALFSKPE